MELKANGSEYVIVNLRDILTFIQSLPLAVALSML